MATKYNTVTETVTAIQFSFDTLKEIYLFLDMRDVSYSVKNRTITGVLTNKDGTKLYVQKTDFVVKDSNGNVTIWTKDDFNKHFTEVKTSA